MTIHLSGDREQLVLSLLSAGKFASSDAVIDKALRLVEVRYQRSEEPKQSATFSEAAHSDDQAARQRAKFRRLVQKLDSMPSASIADGLSNRDHDRMLYGK
jgi:Arc/MetJ-type ribon-helix-helix transcriptional regulator